MIKEAEKLLSKGFNLIVVGRDKTPLMDSWKEYQTKMIDKDFLNTCLEFNTEAQIAVITGKISNLIILDFDIDKETGKIADTTWVDRCNTTIVKTPSGGRHYYFKYADNVDTTAINLPDGCRIDVKSNGGYCLCPPSKTAVGDYVYINQVENLSEFPFEEFRLLFDKPINKLSGQDWNELFTEIKEGCRNVEGAKMAGLYIAAFKNNLTLAWQSFVKWNLTTCKPPLGEAEMKTIFNSIKKRELAKPDYQVNPIQSIQAIDLMSELKIDLKAKKKFFSWGIEGLDVLFPLIEKNSHIILYGLSGSGKTLFSFNMARVNAAKGEKPLFITLEMSAKDIVRRYVFQRAGISKEDYRTTEIDETIYDKFLPELTGIKFLGIDNSGTWNCQRIDKVIAELKPTMVFVDNLGLVESPGKMELDKQMFVSNTILFLARKYQTPIILLHHANKTAARKIEGEKNDTGLRGTTGLRGSMKIEDNCDILIEIARGVTDKMTNIIAWKDRMFNCKNLANIYLRNGIFENEF